SRPKLTASYNGRFDGGALAPLLGVKELRSGLFEIGGNGEYSDATFSATGRIAGKDVNWRDKSVDLRGASGSAKYAVSPSKLSLTEFQGRALSGSVTGGAEVVNWRVPNGTPSQKSRFAGREQNGTLTLKFRDVSVEALSAALASKRMPVDKLKLAGTGSGAIDAKWRSTLKDSQATFSASISPPSQVSATQVPLTAHAEGTYLGSSDELLLSDLTLSTRATQAHASGRLSKKSSLRISATTT